MGLVFLCLIFSVQIAQANFASLENLSDADLETIVKEFSANLVHTSVTPPTSLGKNFGVEVALVGGIVESPGIDQITQRESPGTEVPVIPHAWLLMGVSVPFGISFELNFLPDIDVQDLNINHTSAAVKWSITDQFLKSLPIDIAVRTYYGTSELGFNQIVPDVPTPGSNGNVEIGYENTTIGAETLVGIDAGIIEPYVGVGFVESDATLRGVATVDPTYSIFFDGISQQKSLKQSSPRFLAGFQLHLAVLNFSLEYSHVFSASRVSGKMGLAF